MGYVITSNGAKPGYIVERSYMGYKARDYIAPLYYVYGGRLSCSGALTFDTIQAARNYLNGHNGLIPDTWKICEYDPCSNNITREV
jgi:hypothetical protein